MANTPRLITPLPAPPQVLAAAASRTSLSSKVRQAGTANPLWDFAPSLNDPRSGTQLPQPGPLPVPTVDREPLRWQFPYSYNQQITPGGLKQTPFAVLRRISEVYDIARICIETRKDQMTSLEWDIVPRDSKKTKLGPAAKKRQEDLRTFWRRPDRKRTFATWFRQAIEEVLVIDALSIYRRRNFGGGLNALEIKAGEYFIPLLDGTGDTPAPPQAAYRQVLYGAPVIDLTTDQLMYRPRTVRAHTPYGLSPTEAVLLTVNSALNREVFNLQYYSEGNIPEGIMDAPATWSPEQIQVAQAIMDENLSGNLAARRRLRIVGNGMARSVYQFKEPDFAGDYDRWLMEVTCASFAVPPSEIGFTQNMSRATGQHQENVVYRRGVKPLDGYFSDLFNEILEDDLESQDFKFEFTGGEAEDELVKAQTRQIQLHNGAIDLDDWRQENGADPVGLGPMFMLPTGPIMVSQVERDEEVALASQATRVEMAKHPPIPPAAPVAPGSPAGGKEPGAGEPGPGGEGTGDQGTGRANSAKSPSGEKGEPAPPGTNIPKTEKPGVTKAVWPQAGWMQGAPVEVITKADEDEDDFPGSELTDIQKEMRQFRALAIRRVKQGRPIQFKADHLPGPVVRVIQAALVSASTVEDVVKVFDAATPAVRGAATGAQVGRALAAHGPQVIHVHPPAVHVSSPPIHVAAPQVTVQMPAPRAPIGKRFVFDDNQRIVGVRYEGAVDGESV